VDAKEIAALLLPVQRMRVSGLALAMRSMQISNSVAVYDNNRRI
jgi:hypothetical protein